MSEGNPQSAGVLVLGAARSGTSATTHALVAGGFFAGEKRDLLGSSHINEFGHYELLQAIGINEEALKRMGHDCWMDPPTPAEQLLFRSEAMPYVRAALDSLIEAARGAPVVIKDPRINNMLTLWEPVIEGVLHPVLVVRDPLEVALSHRAWQGVSITRALAVWEVQVTSALKWLDRRTTTIAPYAELTARPEAASELLHAVATHLDPPRASRLRPLEASSVLRPDQRRQRAGDLEREDRLTVRQAELWRYLSQLSVGDAVMTAPAQVSQR